MRADFGLLLDLSLSACLSCQSGLAVGQLGPAVGTRGESVIVRCARTPRLWAMREDCFWVPLRAHAHANVIMLAVVRAGASGVLLPSARVSRE